MLDAQPLFGSFRHDLLCSAWASCHDAVHQQYRSVVALMPVVHTYCSTNGVSSELPVILITIACCLAFLTPAASSTAAMLHGNDHQHQKHLENRPFLIVLFIIVASAVVILIGKVFLADPRCPSLSKARPSPNHQGLALCPGTSLE